MKICSVPNCGRKHYGNGYCQKHHFQFKTHGKIFERTRYDPNEIIIEDQICRMKLYNNKNEEVTETFFDLKYKSEIEKYKWYLFHNNYVATTWVDENNQHHIIMLHQAIIQMSGQVVPDRYEIDHEDRKPLNNLEENLRICTESQNQHNRIKQINNTSGYKGVCWIKQKKLWKAQICIDKQQINLGTFDSKEKAAKVYNDAALKYHSEFAQLNTI